MPCHRKPPISSRKSRSLRRLQRWSTPGAAGFAVNNASGNGSVTSSGIASGHGRCSSSFPFVAVMPSGERLTPRRMSRAPSRSTTGAAKASNSPNEAGSSTETAPSGTSSKSGHASDFPVTSTSPPRVERIRSRSARYSTAKSIASATSHSTLTATHSTPSVAMSRNRSPSPTNRTDRTTTSG